MVKSSGHPGKYDLYLINVKVVQLTGFYIISILALNELISKVFFGYTILETKPREIESLKQKEVFLKFRLNKYW